MKRRALSLTIFSIIFLSSVSICIQTNQLIVSADSSDETWNFTVLGDTRNWEPNITNIYRQTIMEDVYLSNPNMDFIIQTGDLTHNGGEQDDWDLYYQDIDLLVQNDVTIYNAVGNHEMYTYPFPNGTYGPLETNFSTYMANVDLPGNERFYSFDHKGIHFIFINTDEYFIYDDGYQFDITPEQEDWIHNDLQTNTMNFTIAIFHRPCYSLRDTSRSYQGSVIRGILEPIFFEYDITLVFSGHDHYYYNTKREGIQHIVTAAAGAPLADLDNTGEAIENDVYFSEYHYCNVTVTDEVITIEALVYDENLEYTTVEDTVTVYIVEPTKTNSSFYFGVILILVWIIPLVSKKNRK